jgi:hypothetical protein
MWKFLKIEIKYNIFIFVNISIVSFLSFLGYHFFPAIFKGNLSNTNVGYQSLYLMYFLFAMSILSTPWAIEKRVRQLAQLPVSARTIGISHLLLFITFWMYIIGLYFVYTGISQYYSLAPPTLISLCSMTGLVFFLYAFFVFSKWIRASIFRKSLEGFIILFLGFIALAGIIHSYQHNENSNFFDIIITWIFQSKISALILPLSGLGLSILLLLSLRHRSYVE